MATATTSRAHSPRALHVERRIADHPHICRIDVAAQVGADFGHCSPRDVVALVVLIAEAATDEVVPEPVMAELVLCPRADIAGQKAEHHARTRVEMGE